MHTKYFGAIVLRTSNQPFWFQTSVLQAAQPLPRQLHTHVTPTSSATPHTFYQLVWYHYNRGEGGVRLNGSGMKKYQGESVPGRATIRERMRPGLSPLQENQSNNKTKDRTIPGFLGERREGESGA